MKSASVLIALLTLAASNVAMAHAHLLKSEPANGSTIATPPKNIVLTFNEAARLTTLSLEKDGEKPQSLAPLPSTSSKDASVALPTITAGHYAVKWRAMSDDNHVTSGEVQFTVAPPAATK
jgi:methionine-rich copper-binding protein CopC